VASVQTSPASQSIFQKLETRTERMSGSGKPRQPSRAARSSDVAHSHHQPTQAPARSSPRRRCSWGETDAHTAGVRFPTKRAACATATLIEYQRLCFVIWDHSISEPFFNGKRYSHLLGERGTFPKLLLTSAPYHDGVQDVVLPRKFRQCHANSGRKTSTSCDCRGSGASSSARSSSITSRRKWATMCFRSCFRSHLSRERA
jgi:hypothetical protein